jgi:hypothetical protein
MVVIKNCALVLAPCLTVLTDRILNDGIFPKTSKVATVIPIPKVQLSQNPSDYRPISLLPLLGKVIEKHINDMVLDHIEPQLSDLQFGFRKSRSTTDAILLFQHYIFRGFEACEKSKRAANVVAVYFDIAKAFDTVPHSTLLNYLHTRFNVPTHLMAVLNSYLANRTMRVKVGNSLSNSCMVTSGVPQGSVLGPTLFLAYINSVSELTLNEDSKLILFADDMVLIHALNSDSEEQKIQQDCDKISSFTTNMELRLNISKCKYQVFSLSNAKQCTQLKLDGVALEQVNSYKYLGIDTDDKLSLACHTARVVTAAKKAIGALYRTLRKWSSKKVFSTAITTLVLPVILYAIEAWYPPHKKHREKLERVLKYAARLVANNFSRETTYEELLQSLKWKPFYRMVVEKRLLLIKKYMDGQRFMSSTVFQFEPSVTNRFSQRIRSHQHRHPLILATLNQQKNKLEENMSAAHMRKLWNAMKEEVVQLRGSVFRSVIEKDETYLSLCQENLVDVVDV